MITVDRDDFEIWASHPVTELLIKGLKAEAARAKQVWVDASWDGERNDTSLLVALKERARLALELSQMDAGTIEVMLNGADEEA
ncbi:hypothetical protein [uncultured Paracoccus sp.]|uniref:hypothetical protein n=1 Tax=uncultured Paracoccus sp. TaxID=189685 RepID=UPI0026394AAA|nr:hypothetical protein [uncultured Paracoccus sp.]